MSDNRTNFRENVAKWISVGVIAATGFLGVLGVVMGIIYLYRIPGKEGIDEAQKVLQFVFTALLPLWGTWIGTVLAYYFSKENFESANKHVRDLVGQMTTSEYLKSMKAVDVMMPYDKLIRMDIAPDTDPDTLKIKDLFDHIIKNQIRRSLIFKEGKVVYTLHKSLLSDFLYRHPDKPEATIADMKNDGDKDIQNAFRNGVGVINREASLLDAKNLIENLWGCQDVYVTETGGKHEKVLGWISNVDVLKHSKVK
jgi:hypothetical protein